MNKNIDDPGIHPMMKPLLKPEELQVGTHYGASFMKWYWVKKYRRRTNSRFHFPEVSLVTGKPIDWMYGEPKSGYEAVKVFGPNTLELKNLPMGRTPQYMEERLRRFFSKFGAIVHCRAVPHPLDPYQCEGTGFITLKSRKAALQAVKAPLKFPASLHDKVVKMRDLDTDKQSDAQQWTKIERWDRQLCSVAEQLHSNLLEKGERSLEQAFRDVSEIDINGRFEAADESVFQRFGGWKAFLQSDPFYELFHITPEGVLRPLLVTSEQRRRILIRARHRLREKRQEDYFPHWRAGRVALPAHTERNIRLWDYSGKDPLPEELQIMSRSTLYHVIHDEKFLLKRRMNKVRNARRKEVREEYRAKYVADKERRLTSKREASERIAQITHG